MNATDDRIENDVLMCLNVLKEIRWKNVNAITINRIIYFALVLNGFYNKEKLAALNAWDKSQEQQEYYYDDFMADTFGPESKKIINTYRTLRDQGVILDDLTCTREVDMIDEINIVKMEWLKDVASLFIYFGSGELFNCISDEPEYCNALSREDKKIMLCKNNQMVGLLEQLKKDMEKKEKDIGRFPVMQVYFEYVYNQIHNA